MLPEFALSLMIVSLLTILSLDLSAGRPKKVLALESINALSAGLVLILIMYLDQLFSGPSISAITFYGYVCSTHFTVFIKFLVLMTGLFILRSSISYVRSHRRHMLEYPTVMVLSILFMLLIVAANHLVAAFAALVGFSLNLYVLILFETTSSAAREAGIKYYYLSTFSSGLILYGIFLLSIAVGSSQLDVIDYILSTSSTVSYAENPLFVFAFAFLFTGLFFKLSAFPGHL
jgi:NADH-quinone oxidoreductase subunit N